MSDRRTASHKRLSAGAVLLLLSLIGLASCEGNESTSGPVSPTSSTSTSTAPSSASPTSPRRPASWRRLAASPITGSYYTPAAAVWDGQEMLVVVTQSDPMSFCKETLLAYDPSADTWRTLSRVPTPEGCFEGADKAVWTGDELLLWGISNTAYDPDAGTWRHLPDPPAGDGGPSVVVWTGEQMIGWGGGCCDVELAEGAAYTPATDAWRMLPPAPLLGEACSWCVDRERDDHRRRRGVHGIPAGRRTDSGPLRRWGRFRSSGAHVAEAPPDADPPWWRLLHGDVRRGLGRNRGARRWRTRTPTASDEPLARGVAYDPTTNRWRWLPPMDTARTGFVAVWTGDQLVVWGGVGANGSIPPGGETYDPWRTPGPPSRRHRCARGSMPWPSGRGRKRSSGVGRTREREMLIR